MNHQELLYYRLYPHSMRLTVRDNLFGTYVYLCKNEDDTNDGATHLVTSFGANATIQLEHLWEEV